MRTECLNNTNFQGKLIIVNKLSNKPEKCVRKVQDNIQNLVKQKDYNLYLQQDYSKNKICISAKYPFPLKSYQKKLFVTAEELISPNSKASKYIDTSAKVINQFENNLQKKEQQMWKQEQKKRKIENIKDVIETILLSPVFIAEEIIRSINPKWANKFENLLQKIGI